MKYGTNVDTRPEYWTRPTRTCAVCEKEFSPAVAEMHERRTGHKIGPVVQNATA